MKGVRKAPQKVYCIEKNEIFPSVTFVKDRVCSNVWRAIQDPTRVSGGYHWRLATPEDELTATVAKASDYPKKVIKKKPRFDPSSIDEDYSGGEYLQTVKRGWTNEELARWKKSKALANKISVFLNELEKIFVAPKTETEKIEDYNVAALLVGKLIISFTSFCDMLEIYAERGARGGKIKKRAEEDEEFEEENKEDEYEFQEVE